MKTTLLHLRTGLLWMALSLFGIQPLHAQDRTLEVKDLLVEIEILKNGELNVREVYEVNFLTPHQGIWRTIPGSFHYRHPDGRVEKNRLDILNIKVPGWKYDVDRKSGHTGVQIGEKGKFIDGLHKYEIRYTVRGAVIREATQDIFYWNLLGNEWGIPVHQVRFSIQLPDPVELQTHQYAAYNGSEGDTALADFSYDNGLFRGASNVELGNGRPMTALLKLPQNYFDLPTAAQKNLRDYGPFLWFLPILIGFFSIWRKHGKNEKLPIAVEYFPPEGIDPVQAGYLMDGITDTRDITCMIPYWGAGGYLSLQEEEGQGWFRKNKITLKKIKPLPEGRLPYEYTMFNGLFKEGNEVDLESLKNKFYTTMEEVRGKLREQINQGEYYERNSRNIGIGLFIFFVLLGAAGFLLFPNRPLIIVAWMIISILLAIAAIVLLRKRTPKGNAIRRRILGFRMFMDKAEKNQLQLLLKDNPGYFEKTLPYAVAFGLMKKWAGKFEGLDLQPPAWYHSTTYNNSFHYSPSGFAHAFHQSLGSLSTTMVSSPGGGSGGGSAGGGAGGGGGGGW